MSRASVLARARAAAQAGMVDACTIIHINSQYSNPLDGRVTDATETIYTGPCRVQQSQLGAASSPDTVGQAYLRLLALQVQLPVVGTDGIAVDDQITITACAHDVDLVGRVLRVVGLAHKTEASARRLECMEVTS